MDTNRCFSALPDFPLADMVRVRKNLERKGVDVINLGAGDADLDPPPPVIDRMCQAVGETAYSRYPFQAGLSSLREAIAVWMKDRFGVIVDPWKEVLPLIGSKEGIAHLPFALLNDGDAAIIPDPGYQAYVGSVTLTGGDPLLMPLRAENDFLIPLSDISGEVANRAKILYMNYPNNPTTAVAPDSYFEQVIAYCAHHGVVLAHDHAYSEIAFDGYRPRSVLEFEGAKDIAIEYHSFSKTYNMTGWRLGWAVGNTDLISILSKVKSFLDTGQFLAVQAAGAAALACWKEWVPGNVTTFQKRRNTAVQELQNVGFDISRPRATMYLWVPVPTGESSGDFAARALETEGVAVLPGSALGRGGEGFFRIALTRPEARLAEAVQRLGRLL